MKLVRYIFPVESYDREFDSKLLLALSLLANDSPVEILIGFDKHITQILNFLDSPSILMDKSCSDIMYKSRFLPILQKNGYVTVSDEEGVNNITNNFDGLITRFDPNACRDIQLYFTWGPLDYELALQAGISPEKIIISGNPRISLLSDHGNKYYEPFINGLKNIFGEFYLFNENFCIETYDPAYKPPSRSYLSSEQMDALNSNRELKRKAAAEERDSFMRIFYNLVIKNPSICFVVRPHPMSDPSRWYGLFGKFRNVIIIYRESVEPWLFACKALISCGCTTALQAALIQTPVYHFSASELSYSNSLASNVGLPLSAINFDLPYQGNLNKDLLYAQSVIQSTTSPVSNITQSLIDLSQTLMSSRSITTTDILYWRSKVDFYLPFEPKWRPNSLSYSVISDKLNSLSNSFGLSPPKLSLLKVSSGVFSISNVN